MKCDSWAIKDEFDSQFCGKVRLPQCHSHRRGQRWSYYKTFGPPQQSIGRIQTNKQLLKWFNNTNYHLVFLKVKCLGEVPALCLGTQTHQRRSLLQRLSGGRRRTAEQRSSLITDIEEKGLTKRVPAATTWKTGTFLFSPTCEVTLKLKPNIHMFVTEHHGKPVKLLIQTFNKLLPIIKFVQLWPLQQMNINSL